MSSSYLYTFLQTCLLELPFYAWFLRPHLRPLSLVAVVLAINALTHPIVFFVIMPLKINLVTNILIAEPFAFGIEALALWYFVRLPMGRAWAASSVANFVSWQFGSILTYEFLLK